MSGATPSTEDDAPGVSARRFFGNTAAVGVSTGSKAVAYFVVSLAITRVLDVEALGVFTVALTTAMLALRVADLGVGTLIVRDTARDSERGPELVGSGLLLRLPGLALMVATIALVAEVLDYSGQNRMLMWLLGGYAAAESVSRVLFSNAHGRMRMEEEAWIAVPASVVLGTVSVVVLFTGGSLAAVGAVFALVGALQLLAVAILVSSRAPGWHKAGRWSTVRSLLRQGWPIGVAGLAAVVYYRIDTLMLAALVGDVPAGEYSMAYNLLYGPNLLIWAVMAAAFPVLALAGGETGPLQRSHYRRLTGAAAAAGAVSLLVIPFAAFLLNLLYGSAPTDATASLRILLVAQLFTFMASATGTTFNATGAQRTNLLIVVTGVVVNVGLNLVIIPRFGAPGAASTTIVTEALIAITGLTVLFRRGLRPFFAPAVTQENANPR